jgi:hypothetical protein
MTKRLSLDEIAERLALPKTTVYCWIKDLPLERERKWSDGQRKGTEAMQRKFRALRDEAYARGLVEYDNLIQVPQFRDFVVLYIAEGYKRSRNRVAVGNSDERVVALTSAWCKALSQKQPRHYLQYHADQDLDELRSHWGAVIGIDGSSIGMQRKSNSGQLQGRMWRSRYGVLTVVVSDTYFRSRLQAWIDRIKDDWALDFGV